MVMFFMASKKEDESKCVPVSYEVHKVSCEVQQSELRGTNGELRGTKK